MATFRHKKGKTGFTRIENSSLQDSRLSWKARGLLAYMLSKPDDFKFHLDELTKHAPDGLDSVRAGLKELQTFGYVKRFSVKVKGKIVSWELEVFETPQLDIPQVEKPQVGNPMLITNDLITNDLNKKDKRYTDFIGDTFLKIYNDRFKEKFGKDHPKVTEDQMADIQLRVDHLKCFEVTEEEFIKATKEHFETLPKGNDGKIFAFLQASARYFEIPYFEFS